MLADVMKEKQLEKEKIRQEEINKWNHPIKRETIIYYSDFHIIGGIETWIYNLAQDYEFSVVYKTADKNQLKRLEEIGVEVIKDVGQKIECDTLIFTLIGYDPKVKAKKRILFIHGIYKNKEEYVMPECDEIYAVSEEAAKDFRNVSGKEVKVLYNPLKINKAIEPIFIGVFSRLSSEKGRWRIEHIINELESSNKPFIMFIFTDLPFDCDSNKVVFIEPTLNTSEWMKKCDWILNPSDKEAGCYTIQEALKLGKPVITTKLSILEEFKVNESNAMILEFDMSNLDINKLWNIPKFKWSEPISKGWEEIMKKRVFRERRKEVEIPKVEEVKKKTTKKKVTK